MAINMKDLLARVTTFNGFNWLSFAKDVQVLFQLDSELAGSWEIVNGSKPRPYANSDEAAAWDNANTRAYSLIYFLLEPEYRGVISDVKGGAAAWAVLRQTYEALSSYSGCYERRRQNATTTPSFRLALRKMLIEIRHDPTKPVSVFIDAVLAPARQLGLRDAEVAEFILKRLHPSFAPMNSVVGMQGRPTVGEVVAAVRAFEVGRDLQGKDENVKRKEWTSYVRPTAARCKDATHAFVIKLPSCSPTASVGSDNGEDEIVFLTASEDSDVVVAAEGKNGKVKEDGVVAEKKKKKARRGTRGGAGRRREKPIVIPHDSDSDA